MNPSEMMYEVLFLVDIASLPRSNIEPVISSRSLPMHLMTSVVLDYTKIRWALRGLTIVAQRVENNEQAQFLKAHAGDEFQGFYFNKPLSTHKFTQLLWAQ